MPSTCKFVFDRPNPIYYSGETINGCITLQTDKEKTVRGVYIVFNGGAKVHWIVTTTTRSNGRKHYHHHHRNGKETYLSTYACVFGDGTLPPGTHEYTFSITLPLECPSSCTEIYGHINYEITLKIERPLRYDNEFTQPLSVIKPLNLNSCPELLIPIKSEHIKYFCCWPCSSGPVISTLTIPFGGWAPGQEITYKLEIDNQSRAFDLSGTKLMLVQTYHFTATDAKNYHDNTLAQLEQEDHTVMRFSKRTYEGKLRIPPVPPTYMGNGIITVSYRVEMCLITGDCHDDYEIKIPITIGTIPLAQTATNPNHIIALPATALSPDTPDSLDMPPRYDVCMSPTFEEATHIGEKFKDTDNNDYQNKSTADWKPKYPVYNNFSVPTAPPTDNFSVLTAASVPSTDFNERNVIENRPLLSKGFNIIPQSAPNTSK